MCGRYTLALPAVQVSNRFNVTFDASQFRQHFNAAPGQSLPVITNSHPASLSYFKWGLIPHWAKDPRMGYKMINARAETLLEKPAFSPLLKQQRCLVIADGFYEWATIAPKVKQPYRIGTTDFAPFAMAGLWSTWKDAEQRAIHTFSIITVAANALVAPVHDRMPAILAQEHEQDWLDSTYPTADCLALLQPYPEKAMEKYKVSDRVNKATIDEPALLTPLATGDQGALF